MRNFMSHGEVIRGLTKTTLAIVSLKDTALKLWALLLVLAIIPIVADAQGHAIQYKACPGLVCTLDKPVGDGNLLVVIGSGGCDPKSELQFPQNCQTVSDNQANVWQTAEIVPNNNGTILWYALNARGGNVSIYRSVGFNGTIVAEYPPSLGLEDANLGTYTFQNHGDAPQGGSSDLGHTEPVEVTFPNDLVITWATAGALGHNYTAGPFFSLAGATPEGAVGFEDMIAVKPGLYMGTMGWDGYAHWTMGVAAFRMGTIAVQNPSFEEPTVFMSGSKGPSTNGPIPGWQQWGNSWLWQPIPSAMSVPDGKTIVSIDGVGGIYQDLGQTSARAYKLTVSVGNRSGGVIWTISLNAGTTVICTTSGSTSSIPVGEFATQTLLCNVPAGDLTIVMGINSPAQGQGAFDNVMLTTTESVPPWFRRGKGRKRKSNEYTGNTDSQSHSLNNNLSTDPN